MEIHTNQFNKQKTDAAMHEELHEPLGLTYEH